VTRITNRPLEKGFHCVESALDRVNQKNTNGENGGDQEHRPVPIFTEGCNF